MKRPEVREIGWNSPEMKLVDPGDFETFYPSKARNPALVKRLRAIGGGEIILACLYGSVASGDASKTSLTDIFIVVRNPVAFYGNAIAFGEVKFGTVNDSGIHALWGEHKQNFYLTRDGKAKLWVSTQREMIKHARGAMPGIEGGKGKGYAAGRWQKTEFPILIDDATEKERQEIGLALNQARLAGVWQAIGLCPRIFAFDLLAGTYANLSYLADKRVEKASKSGILVDKNFDHYTEMLSPILRCFVEKGILVEHLIKNGDSEEVVYEKKISLAEKAVRKWIKEEASSAFWTNFLKNTWTMGPINGLFYGLAKVFRAKGWFGKAA